MKKILNKQLYFAIKGFIFLTAFLINKSIKRSCKRIHSNIFIKHYIFKKKPPKFRDLSNQTVKY
jgi:hypothetical protein